MAVVEEGLLLAGLYPVTVEPSLQSLEMGTGLLGLPTHKTTGLKLPLEWMHPEPPMLDKMLRRGHVSKKLLPQFHQRFG